MMRFFYAIILALLFYSLGGKANAANDSYIANYKRSNVDSYQIISRDKSGNRWKVEKDWKLRRSSVGRIVRREYEKVLLEKRVVAGILQYDIDYQLYERNQEIETRIDTSYTLEGRPDHYEVDFIGFETYSISICGMKSAIIMLRSGLKQEHRLIVTGNGQNVHRYYYDHIFLNLEKDGEAVFYPDPLDSSIIDGPIFAYFDKWSEKVKYNCKSGYITFE